MSRIIGIDPGTQKMGWAIVEGGNTILNYGWINAGSLNYEVRIPTIIYELEKSYREYKCTDIAVERAIRWNGRQIAALETLCQAIRVWSKRVNPQRKIGEYNVSEWKSNMLGNYRANAEFTQRTIEALFPRLKRDLPEHIHDAIYIAMYHHKKTILKVQNDLKSNL